jgi:hypothetical protein
MYRCRIQVPFLLLFQAFLSSSLDTIFLFHVHNYFQIHKTPYSHFQFFAHSLLRVKIKYELFDERTNNRYEFFDSHMHVEIRDKHSLF